MYNAQNAKELDGRKLPSDTIFTGVITNISDGKVKDFVNDATKWENAESQAIQLSIEVMTEKGDKVNVQQLFTYIIDNGQTSYTKTSNLGKYKAKYGKLPEVGDLVKILTNGEGYGKIKLN